MRLGDTSEIEFLRGVQKALGGVGGGVRLGIGDDAAVIDCPPGRSLVLTCDAAVEGCHFRREWFAEREIGERAVRCAMSDLAATGAEAAAVLLTLIVSPDEEEGAARELIEGAARASEDFGARLVGGETVGRDGPLTLDVIAAGFVASGRELRRSGAQPGDVVVVSGTLGDSAAGLALLTAGLHSPEAAIARYKRPEPRVALGVLLAESGIVHAAIDISDGLVRDAGHVAEQSGVAIVIRADALPLSPACQSADRPISDRHDSRRTTGEKGACHSCALRWALAGGEDFELLFCVEPEAVDALGPQVREQLALQVSVIGEVVEGRGVRVVQAGGSELTLGDTGWDQFQAR